MTNPDTTSDKPKITDADGDKPSAPPPPDPKPKRFKARVVRSFMEHRKGDRLDLVENKQTLAWVEKNLVERVGD